MPIDSVYSDDTQKFLAGQNAANLQDPVPPPPSTGLGSIARAVGRGLGQGAASLGGGIADTTAGLSQLYSDPVQGMTPEGQAMQDKQINAALAAGKAGTLFQSKLGANAYDFAASLKPDPNNTTTIDQIVQGATSALTQIVPATLAGGPLAGAAVGGASMGLSRAEDLKREGVDVGTRTAVGAVAGVAGAAGALVPVGGSTLATTAGLVAAAGPGATIAQSAAEKAILKNAGYDHLSDQINPLDPVNLAASTLTAGVFGGLHLAGARAAAGRDAAAAPGATPAPAPAAGAAPLTDMTLAARKALPYNAPALDDYATQVAQREGVPPALLLFIKNRGEMSNSNQTSPAGAKGVMQFTEPTWQQYGNGGDRTDPVASIDAAGRYAKDLLARYDGDARAAVTEYNGGIAQARAVQGGGAPTATETINYLRRYDQYAAEHAINNTPFNPTPDQVDAALGASSQRIVDDAHVFGAPGDIDAMSAHQDAFELAARQMDTGQIPDVTSLVPETDFGRARVLDDMIGSAENFRSSLAADAGGLAEPGAISNIRDELDSLNAARPDDSPAGIKAMARGFQDNNRMSYKAALSRAQKETASAISDHEAQVERLQRQVDTNAEAQQARQRLDVIDSHLADMRAARQAIDAPYTRLSPIAEAVRGIEPPPRGRYARPAETPDPVVSRSDAVAEAGPAAEAGRPGEAQGAESPTESAAAASGPREAAPPTPIESNLQASAAADPTMQVHLDADSGERSGTIADMLSVIDEEHAAATRDADLLTAAAQCFIS